MFNETVVFEKANNEAFRLENEAPVLEKGRFLFRTWSLSNSDPKVVEKFGQPNEIDIDQTSPNHVYAWWFDTPKEREVFRKQLLEDFGVGGSSEENDLVKKRTIVVATLRYKGKDYVVKRSYGYGYSLLTAIFDWEENNNSCDHNRAFYIDKFYPGAIPDDDPVHNSCGPEFIEVVDFQFELLD